MTWTRPACALASRSFKRPISRRAGFNLVHHLTPEVLWQERFLDHPNNALALSEVFVAVAEPAESVARFSRLVGCPAIPDPASGFALDLANGRVRLLQDPALRSVLPDVVTAGLPRIVFMVSRYWLRRMRPVA
jgi:hypothetical protein